MTEQTFFDCLLIGWFAVAAVTFVALFFVTAPYGRHARSGWGPTVESRLGWVTMEAPAALVFAACFALGVGKSRPVALAFLGLWEAHYVHRAFIYPFGLRGEARRMPVTVVGMAILFNAANGYLNGRQSFSPRGIQSNGWETHGFSLV
jgi:3-oxo-5-alpha-steroid 4-dehydrogenase 1